MTGAEHLIIEYRYLILLPLSFVEGPIVAFIAGTLASLGYFNIWALAVFFLARDVIVDLFYYLLGKFGGRTALAHRLLGKIGLDAKELESVRHLWLKYPGRTMFFSKLSYGIAAAFILVAGIVEMPLNLFMGWGAAIAVMHYGTLLFLGYYFGSSFGSVSKILQNIQYVVSGVILVVSAYYIFTFYMRKRLEAQEKKEEAESTGQ